MRGIWAVFAVAGFVIACSSSDDAGDECQVVGTYSVVETRQSGDCPQSDTPDTFTISKNGEGYFVEYAGVTGGCAADAVGQCKIQGKCDLAVKDPVDPAKSTGTLQFSWTFDASGLKGSMTFSVPPAAAAPQGCTSDYNASGTRK